MNYQDQVLLEGSYNLIQEIALNTGFAPPKANPVPPYIIYFRTNAQDPKALAILKDETIVPSRIRDMCMRIADELDNTPCNEPPYKLMDKLITGAVNIAHQLGSPLTKQTVAIQLSPGQPECKGYGVYYQDIFLFGLLALDTNQDFT